MPRSQPPLFDEGGDNTGDTDRDITGAGHRSSTTGDLDDEYAYYDDEPNYLIRRALVIAAVVAVLVVAATAVGWFLRDNDDDATASITGVDWNAVVMVEETTGTVVVNDSSGPEVMRIRLGAPDITDAAMSDTTLVATNDEETVVVDLTEPEVIERIAIVAGGPILRPSGTNQTLIVRDTNSQRAVMIHGPSGEVLDSDAIEPIVGARYDIQLARSDPAGRNIVVTDAGNFQSVLFSFDRDAPSFFPGLALAVDPDLVVTTQNVGNAANVSVFDHDQNLLASASTPSVRAAITNGDAIVIVTVDGTVLSMDADSGDVSEVASLMIGTVESGHVSIRGDRLVIIGNAGTALLDADGSILTEVLGGRPTTTDVDAVAPRRTTCLIVAREDAGDIVVVELETGDVVAEAVANPDVHAGADGCEPITPTTIGYQVLTADGVLRTRVAGNVVAVAPDGTTIVTDSLNRLALLERIDGSDSDDDEPEPIDIGRSGRAVLFTNLP